MNKRILGNLMCLVLFTATFIPPLEGSLPGMHESTAVPTDTSSQMLEAFLKVHAVKKSTTASGQTPGLHPFPGKQESVQSCSISSNGTGTVLPMFLFPRPRLVTLWVARSGTTFAINLETKKGYNASGKHIGLAVGFIGIGFTYLHTEVPHYIVVGRAYKVNLYGENISAYPP